MIVLVLAGVAVYLLVSISFQGSVLAFNLSYLFDRTELLQELIGDLVRRLQAGEIRAPAVSVYPLDQVARAHEALESGQTVGKLVLVP